MKAEMQGDPALVAKHLTVSYHHTPVLQDVSLCVWPQQIVAIVGLNGAGKTTILKSIGGLVRPVSGSVSYGGERIESLPVAEVVRRGVVYVPEGMSVFPRMTVLENLEVGAYLNRGRLSEHLEIVFSLFPELYERKGAPAGILSGGQQRMVTLGRGLMSGARMLLLDDPFLGLGPIVVKKFCDAFKVIRRSGITLVIAGQHVRRILNVADTAFLVEDGSISLYGSGPELLQNHHLQEILFGIHF